jgi:hypothetical protein
MEGVGETGRGQAAEDAGGSIWIESEVIGSALARARNGDGRRRGGGRLRRTRGGSILIESEVIGGSGDGRSGEEAAGGGRSAAKRGCAARGTALAPGRALRASALALAETQAVTQPVGLAGG